MTIVEEKEYEMIKSGLSFNQATDKWLANYPWIVNPKCLPNNRHFAYATLMSTEKRLGKNQLYAETYQNQIYDMLKRKVARPVSEQELRDYVGPKFYISHHDVLNHQSVNDCLAKGPCLLNE